MSNDLIPMDTLQQMANTFAKSGMFGTKTPEQCMALLLLASGEGIHPAVAMRDFDIIQGRPAKKAEAMLRSFLAAGGKVEWHALEDTIADATFSHPQGGSARITWDMERVKRAKISNEAMYSKYPRAMLRSRCVSEGCRTVYPASTSGLYEPGEIMGFAKEKNMGTAVVVPDESAPPATSPSVASSRQGGADPVPPRSEYEAMCKAAGVDQQKPLRRAGVKSVEELSEDDWSELATVLREQAARFKGAA